MSVRKATADDVPAIASVHVIGWHETYAPLIGAREASGHTQAERAAQWARRFELGPVPPGLFVAESPVGSVAGFVACGRPRGADLATDGEVHAIYLLHRAQGFGLGRALMVAAASLMRRQGHRSAGLWVMVANAPARGFYRHLGGIEQPGIKTFQIGGATIEEVAVVWPDLAALA